MTVDLTHKPRIDSLSAGTSVIASDFPAVRVNPSLTIQVIELNLRFEDLSARCPRVIHLLTTVRSRVPSSSTQLAAMWTADRRLSRPAGLTALALGGNGHGLLPSGPQLSHHATSRGNFFHLHLVSDATGETLITVARAAAAQYASVAPIEHIYPLVRTEKQLDRVHRRNRGGARHRALHHARHRAGRAAADQVPRVQPARACRSSIRCWRCSSPISAPSRPSASARSTRSMPNISSASMRSTTPCCTTTASTPTISNMPTWC